METFIFQCLAACKCTSPSTSNLDLIAKFIPAGITLVIGGFAAYIAWRQHITAREKLKLDLFEKRYQVFQNLEPYFSDIIRQGVVKDAGVDILIKAIHHSKFLFGKDVQKALDDLYNKTISLEEYNDQLNGEFANQDDRKKTKINRRKLISEILQERKNLMAIFRKYMSFPNP